MDFINKPEKLFVICAALFGFLLIFLTPPLLSADEPAHFARVFSLSQGHVKSILKDNKAGNYNPEALVVFEKYWAPMFYDTRVKTDFNKINESKSIKIEKDKSVFLNQCYQSLYSPLAYLPQTIGVWISKHFTSSVYWILITAKTLLLLFYITLGYLALKISPVFKYLIFLILLMPTSLSLAASVSADGVLIPLSVLYFALIFRYSFDEKYFVDKKELALFCFLALCLALVKQSFLIALFIFFIPKNKFIGSYIQKISIILIPAFLSALCWNWTSSQWFVALNGADPVLQIKFILAHPFTYILTILKTVKLCIVLWVYSVIALLGWNNIFLFPPVYVLYFVVMILNAIFNKNDSNEKLSASNFQKLVLFSLFLINFVFIGTELYLSWTKPYFTDFINIIQGRYLIPLVLPFLVFLGFLFVSPHKKNTKLDYFTFFVLFLTYLNLFLAVFFVYYF